MTVQRKLVVGFAVVIAVFTGLAAYHLAVIRESARTSEQLRRLGARLEATSARHLRLLDRAEESASKYWVTRDSGYAARYATARDSIDAMIRDLDARGLTDREREPVDRLRSTWAGGQALPRRLPERLSGLEGGPASDSLRAMRSRIEILRARTRSVNRAVRDAMRSRVEASATAVDRAETVSWIALVAGLLAAGALAWWVIRSILEGLGRLRQGTRAVSEGDFEHRIRIEDDDEFGELADAFNAMTVRLGEVDRLKRRFLSGVSHDLKSPLASVRETLRLLLEGVPGDLNDDQRRLLEMAGRSSDRLAGMIDQLLDLSRMEADAVSYDLRPVDLGELAGEVADEFRPRLHGTARSLSVEASGGGGGAGSRPTAGEGDGDPPPAAPPSSDDGGPAGPVAAVDRDRFAQVLQNLLDNALEHSPEDGDVRVRLEERDEPPSMPAWADERRPRPEGGGGERADDGDRDGREAGADGGTPPDRWVVVSVSDDGPGVEPDQRAAVFERFHQAAGDGGSGGHGGVGLGLTLCREIVEAHGGTIWVEESRTGGSRFRVLVPGEPTAGSAAAGATEEGGRRAADARRPAGSGEST